MKKCFCCFKSTTWNTINIQMEDLEKNLEGFSTEVWPCSFVALGKKCITPPLVRMLNINKIEANYNLP